MAAAVTPCTDEGVPSPQDMERLAGKLAQNGCDGVFIIGSTGEQPLLDDRERRALTEAARQGLGEDCTLYVGVSGAGPRQTLRYAQAAAADGADVVVVMAPSTFSFSQEELYAYVAGLADAGPLPVAIYHHLRMQTAFGVEITARLMEHPNVVAMKDTSTDMERFAELLPVAVATKTALMQGSERLLLESFRHGAAGCVTALAGLAPRWHANLFRACREGDDQAAETEQQRIDRLWEIFRFDEMKTSFSYFARSLKLGLVAQGWISTAANTMPGFVPDAAFDEKVRRHLIEVGLLRNGVPAPHARQHSAVEAVE